MKVIVRAILNLIIFSSILFSQDKDSLIQLYPGLKDTIDQFDRNYFELFKEIEGFERAVFYIRDGEQLVSRVKYSSNGISEDTTFVQPLSALDDVIMECNKILKQGYKSYGSPKDVVIFENNGRRNTGKFKMFNRHYVYLNSETSSPDSNNKNYKFRIPISNIDSVLIIGELNSLPYMGYGALIGFLFGGVFGFASGDDPPGWFSMTAGEKGVAAGSILGLIGGIIGLIIGLISSTDEVAVQINTQNDLLQLKKYAKYYFRYDQSVEEEYVEIE